MGLRLTGLSFLITIVALNLLLAGCAPATKDDGGGSTTVTAEGTYCSSPITYSSNFTTVTSTAQFKRYNDYNGVQNGLYSVETLPIRRAEVVITTSSGTILQCGTTDNSGAISMTIPKSAGSYILKVNSRANNSYMQASVLNNPTNNQYYSISASFSLIGNETNKAVTLTAASHQGTLEGGAFNILDQVLKSNDYLRANTGSCTGCTTVTVAPKISIFWTPGFNPATYLGYSSSNTLSFFLSSPSEWRGLYINGGVNGSICTDTDHFDNSVIIHEYGHFMEDTYAKSDSPGGSHNGNAVIDPRLAWSEGWANFFQGAVLSRPIYRDTKSNVDCGGSWGLLITDKSMENQDTDTPVNSGEGIYREFSITRTLYDVIQSSGADSDGKYGNVGFSYIWQAFSDSTTGFKNSSLHFRNSGLFHSILSPLINSNFDAATQSRYSGGSGLISNEKQAIVTDYYATPVSPTGSACAQSSILSSDPVSAASIYWPLRSNRYFSYYYDGSGNNATLRLKYKATTTGTPHDLDLIVFYEDHDIEDLGTAAAYAQVVGPESTGLWPGLETISLSGKPAGTYLIDVRVDYTVGRSDTTFYLENGAGVQLCP